MANPDFFAQARGEAARTAMQPKAEEELPEDLEDLTAEQAAQVPPARVEAPATVPEPYYEDRFGDRIPAGLEDSTQHTRVEPPMADIAQSPRAAMGGQGESPAEIQATVAEAQTQAAAMEAAVQDVIGMTDIARIKQLLAQHDAGIFTFPPDNLKVLRDYVALHDKGTEYMRANVEGQRAME